MRQHVLDDLGRIPTRSGVGEEARVKFGVDLYKDKVHAPNLSSHKRLPRVQRTEDRQSSGALEQSVAAATNSVQAFESCTLLLGLGHPLDVHFSRLGMLLEGVLDVLCFASFEHLVPLGGVAQLRLLEFELLLLGVNSGVQHLLELVRAVVVAPRYLHRFWRLV